MSVYLTDGPESLNRSNIQNMCLNFFYSCGNHVFAAQQAIDTLNFNKLKCGEDVWHSPGCVSCVTFSVAV
jgi:hypothetical protein